MIETILSRLQAAPPSGGPKYRRLGDLLLDAIAAGDWSPGSRLPTEAELSRALPFSLGTVQKAYGELVRKGVVVRSRGRGSFVASGGRAMAEPWHCRFLDEREDVLAVYPRLVGHHRSPAPRWAGLFGEAVGVTVIDRMLSVADEFELLSRFYVPDPVADALLGLPRPDIERANFKLVLFEQFGTRIARISQTIELAGTDLWQKVGMSGPPHLRIEATAFTGEGDAVYFQELYVPRTARRMLFESDLRA